MMIMINKVLIVEDSDIVVERLGKLLAPLENIQIAGRADEMESAVRLIKELKPDFVILDISLKKGSGIEVLKHTKDFEHKPYIIVLSNLSYKFYKEKCAKLGARHFFDKAHEFEKVYEILYKLTEPNGRKQNAAKP